MKELTLTGATLLDSDDTSLSKVEMASPRENRGSQRVDSASGGFPSTPSSAALELIRQGDPNQIIQALFGIVRMGPFPVFMQLVQTWKDHSGSNEVANSLKEAKDGHGHSLLHWAAKRVDSTQFVEYLLQFIPVSVATSSEDTMMTPLHWACTESHALPIVRMLVNHDRCAVEIADSTGCTPLLIAAQHGQVETVAYLLHHGANLHAVDASRDSATHWAAYKGSLQVLGLLSFYDTRQLTTTDTYGQTPLHLASLRGHKSVCKYILSHVDGKQAVQLLNLRDSNGRTPHALAVHKDKHSVATFLADYYDELTCPKSQKYRRLLQRNLRNMVSPAAWRLWLGITVDSSDVDESPLFPYYYVCAHMLINPIFQLWVFWSVGDASEGVLWDSVLLLVWQMVLYVCGLYSFVVTSSMNPGRIDSSFPHLNKWRQLYESTLEQYASSSAPVASLPQLCHTCHIARPLRSKHDRFTDSCILLFDHHCPYVGCLCTKEPRPCSMLLPSNSGDGRLLQICWQFDWTGQLQMVLHVPGSDFALSSPALYLDPALVEAPVRPESLNAYPRSVPRCPRCLSSWNARVSCEANFCEHDDERKYECI
jgi:ankyrin repeat protein